MFEIKKNFLEKEQFTKLKELITEQDFPWRIRGEMTPGDTSYYFNFSFYNYQDVNSPLYTDYILPIFNQLESKAVIQARANMFLSDLFTISGWHTDYDFKCKTAILYLNSCDGGTHFKINGKTKFIEAEENQIVIFDSNIEHRAVTSKNCSIRYIINLNYFI